jgi:hypothetical protein
MGKEKGGKEEKDEEQMRKRRIGCASRVSAAFPCLGTLFRR